MQFPVPNARGMDPPNAAHEFPLTKAFRDLKALYEGQSASLETLEKQSSSVNQANLKNQSLAPKLVRAQTSPQKNYQIDLEPIGRYFFEEPLISLFSQTRVRISSVDQRSTDDLAHSYKLNFTLNDMKKKCDINLQIVLEDLKILYLSQHMDNIRTLLTCMTQLAAAFMFSPLVDLKAGKCKQILEKLDALENMVYKYLQTISAQTSVNTGNTIVHEPGSIEASMTHLNIPLSESFGIGSGTGSLGKMSIPFTLSNMDKNHFKTPRSIKRAQSVLNDKLSHKEALKILARMKYVIAQLGRLLHYDSVANSVIKSVTNEDKKKAKTKNSKKYSDEDFDESIIAAKKERLNKFWEWKVNKWKLSEPTKNKKNIYQILCPICEKNVKVDQGKQHLELCKERAEVNKRISDLDNKLSDIVFQAFKNMKTIQKTLIVDNKQYSKLKAKFNVKSVTSRSRRASQAVNRLIHGTGSLITRSRSEENKLLNLSTSGGLHSKTLSMQPEAVQNVLQGLKTSPKQDSKKLSPVNTVTQRLLEKYSARSRSREANSRLKRSFDGNPSSSPNKQTGDSENSEDVSPNPHFSNGHTPSGPIYRHLRVNTVKKNFEALLKNEESNKDFSLSARVKPLTPSDESSDVRSNAGDNPFSSAFNPSENGSDSPAISDISFNDAFGLEKSHSNPLNRAMRSNSFAQETNLPLVSHKKSKFYLGKEVLENNIEEDEGGLKEETIGDETVIETELITLADMHTGMLRRSKTGNDELKREMQEFAQKEAAKKDPVKKEKDSSKEEITVIENLKKLKGTMAQKKLKVKIFELIQNQGKMMLNQKAYHKEMELIKEDISIGLQELIEKSKSTSACAFAEKFLAVLESRIESGKNLEEAESKLFKLEGRKKQKKKSSKLLEPSLLRGKSSLPLSSPHKFSKALNGGMDDLTPTRLWKGCGSKADFIRQNQIKEETTARQSSRVLTANDFDNSISEDSRIQYALTERKSTEKKLSGQYQYSMKEVELNSDPKESVQDEEEVTMVIVESKEDLAPSIWNLSLAEMPETKKPDYDISLEKLSQDTRKQSFSSSKNHTSYGNTQQSIVLNDCAQSSTSKKDIHSLQKTPDFLRDNNKPFHFGKKDVQRSMTSPNEIKAFVESNKSQATTSSDEETPKKQKFIMIEQLAFTEDQPIIEISEEFPSTGKANSRDPSESPTKSPSGKFRTGFKSYSGRRLTFGKKSSSPKVSPPNTMELKDENQGITGKRSSLRLMNMLEKVDETDPGYSPMFVNGFDYKTLHKKSETVVKFTGVPVEDKESPTASKLESKESIDSYSSLGSAIGEKGYFSDSEVWKPTRSLKSHATVGIEDFEPIKMISKGAFGRVWLVRKKATKDIYAMKVINLAEKLMKNKDLENLRKENSVFSIAQEEFLVRAVFTFTHETCICFVMEYMLGGDLADLLSNYGALEEDVARFYIAELIIAVEYLHSVGVVHRDLKPDNILLDKSGHSKLTDFGLSEVGLSQKMRDVCSSPMRNSTKLYNFNSDLVKKLGNLTIEHSSIDRPSIKIQAKRYESKEDGDDKEVILRTDSTEKTKRKANRLIGTPDYMAPEIINNVTITSYSSDWWSVGVILFELIVGVPPFNDDTPEKIFENILAMRIPWDDLSIGYGEGMISPEAADLIKKLINPDYTQRLGANGAREIKEHPFFKSINWATLRTQRAPVTFEHVEDTDTQNFARMQDKITEKESNDPFVLIPKGGDVAGNMQIAKQFIETAQDNFNMVNITALYSAGLKLAEETMKEKAKDMKQVREKAKNEGSRKFSDVFETPE